jgi:hypothetical protein
MKTAIRTCDVMKEAIKLAADGELGNSNAIRLLQIPHSPEELRDVISKFDRQLTPQARGKLVLEALAPLPEGVENQRYEPIFDRYPISGRTYTTASGTVVLNEVQYYNGQMVQLYGDCTNVEPVRSALAGTGYKPMTLKHPNGQETALAQFWAHNLSDTSLKPYNAMFIIVAAVPEQVPTDEACIRADENGASSVLQVLDGSYDAAKGRYENKAQPVYVGLLDSTQVAIEFGRERMGTDKRFGTIRMTHHGQQLGFLITDVIGKVVARINVVLTDDPTAYHAPIAKAATTAGIRLGDYPPGTEYVYPGLARIGNGPVVHWQWRTDVLPRFQPILPNTIVFDRSSEDGALLHEWGFRPTVLGFIPNIRGVVTGIPDPSTNRGKVRIKVPDAAVALRP